MRKTLVILAFVLLGTPFAAHATTQVLSGMTGLFANNSQSWSGYISNATGFGRGATIGGRSTIMSAAGTISGLVATSSNMLAGTQTMTISFYKNDVQQTLTCIMNSSGGCSDNAHTFSVVAGDNIQASIVPANTPNANLLVFYSLNFVPTTDNETVVPSGNDAGGPNTGVNSYSGIGYARINWTGVANEGTSSAGLPQALWPDTGTFSNFYYNNNATLAGAGKTITLGLRQNQTNAGTPSQLGCVITNSGGGKCNDTTNSASVIAGDFLDLQAIPSGTPSSQPEGNGWKFVSTTNGNFVTMGGNWVSGAGAAFLPFSGDTGSSTDAGAANTIKPLTLKGFSALCTLAPGVGKTYVITFRQNGIDSGMSCTLSGATQRQCSTTGSISVANGDMIDYHYTTTGSPSAAQCQVNSVASVPVAAVTTNHGTYFTGFTQLLIGLGRVQIF